MATSTNSNITNVIFINNNALVNSIPPLSKHEYTSVVAGQVLMNWWPSGGLKLSSPA